MSSAIDWKAGSPSLRADVRNATIFGYASKENKAFFEKGIPEECYWETLGQCRLTRYGEGLGFFKYEGNSIFCAVERIDDQIRHALIKEATILFKDQLMVRNLDRIALLLLFQASLRRHSVLP
ncbi:MAG: hypothetical protein HC924_09645 [Synechococcaceae cyanobacterium SM2_3_2]|nr:hypothetical protein [Synechococcaceae cyanobacterium SM2_3_2]